MALEKVIAVDRIEVVGIGSVQVRTKTSIMEDGKQISGSFHRHVVSPGDDYSEETDQVKAVCSVTHTNDVISAYKAAIAAQGV